MGEELSPDEVASVSNAMTENNEVGTDEQSKLHTEPTIAKAQFLQLEEVAEAANLPPGDIQRFADLKVKVEVILGNTRKPLEEILKIHPGAVVELDKLAGEPVDLMANNQLIARAEVVVIDDNFGVKILEIHGTQRFMDQAALR